MNKGKYQTEQVEKKKIPLWFILILVVLAVVVVLFIIGGQSEDLPLETESSEQTVSNVPVVQQTESMDETLDQAQQPDSETEESEASSEAQEKQEPQVEATQPNVVIVQRADAEYEEWLSASMIICVSMQYPDFQLEGVYAASATTLEDKFSSDGAYIVFSSDGSRMAIHSQALEAERTQSGTVDISTEAIGYATFDQVDPDALDLSSLDEVALEDLTELINQSLLVSIYTH